MKGNPELKICRLIYEFLPDEQGGSVIHTIELSEHINLYCKNQFLIVPKADTDTTELDKSFSFTVYRVNYLKLAWLHRIKAKYCRWLPLAPIVVLSYDIFSLPAVFRLNRKYRIDVIHAHGFYVGAAATIFGKLLRKPVVWTLDGTIGSASRLSGAMETILVKLFTPTRLVAVNDGSQAVKKFSRLAPGRTVEILHAIDKDLYKPQKKMNELLKKIHLSDTDFIIFSASSLIPIKGVDYTIEAFEQLYKNIPTKNTRLIIGGDGPLRNQLHDMVVKKGLEGIVIFLGQIAHDDMPSYFSIADVFVATATYSNMVLSVQEAMSCAKPVVVFDSGETSKTIQDGKTGILVKTRDVETLAKKFFLLYQDRALREMLGKNAREFIVNERSWEKRVQNELDMYREIIRGKVKQ